MIGIVAIAVAILLSMGRGPTIAQADAPSASLPKATFAGGCFWCMQYAFDHVPGVVATTVGYTGGTKNNPTYEEVGSGTTGHSESIEVTFDPSKTSYRKLLDVFWHNVDPTTHDREFCDVGNEYNAIIFFHDADQEREARESEAEIEKTKPFKDPIVAQIVPASTFYPAEEYHQKYYLKNPVRYKFYHYNCGRAQRLRELWGAASGDE
ncbi:MAG TPA: peptide-methionine (S)-S-oxide reductase MsrA [Candidatus Binataceae bacterium]|nr:peptide-methionine (S)-S-oxide reductase MsrA [Candidatus Binataceae bacterium]